MREKKIFLPCPSCKAEVRDVNLPGHLQRVHGVVSETPPDSGRDSEPQENQNEENLFSLLPKMDFASVKDRPLTFQCQDCSRKSRLAPGQIRIVLEEKKDPVFFFSNEIRCKKCRSAQMDLDVFGKSVLMIRLAAMKKQDMEHSDDLVVSGPMVGADGLFMHYREVLPYFNKKMASGGVSWETYLRYANVLCGCQQYGLAEEAYRKASELNPAAVAPVSKLAEIYFNRWKTYKESEAKAKAAGYCEKAIDLISNGGNMATINVDAADLAQVLLDQMAQMASKNKRRSLFQKTGKKLWRR